MIIRTFALAAILATSLAAQAGNAQPIKGGTCVSVVTIRSTEHYPGGSDGVWNCEHLAEKLSIKQIYEKGFRVVTVYLPFYAGDKPTMVRNYTMIIEEQK